MKKILVVLASVALSNVACKKEEAAPASAGSTTAPAAAAAGGGGTKVSGLPLQADVPAGTEKNEGAPGFHSEDGAVTVLVKEADESLATIAQKKESVEELMFKKWIKSNATPDGWVLTYVGVGIDMDGKEHDNYAFDVRKKVGGKSFDCYGSVKKQADLEANLKICNSLRSL